MNTGVPLERVYQDPAPKLRGDLDLNGKKVGVATAAEIGCLHGASSEIQTQLDLLPYRWGNGREQLTTWDAALSRLLFAPLAYGGNWIGWLTATHYAVGQCVTQSGLIYDCLIDHTSGTFATDLAAGKWRLCQPRIAWIGDSWISNRTITIPAFRFLRSKYGDGGVGYVSANTYTQAPEGIGRTPSGSDWNNTGTYQTQGLTMSWVYSTTLNATYVFDTTASGFKIAKARIYYIIQTGGGTFTYHVDSGGESAPVETSSGNGWVDVDLGSDTSHSLTITVASVGTSGVAIAGVEFMSGHNGVLMSNLGWPGTKTSDWAAMDQTLWGGALAKLDPNLIVITLGVNDCAANVSQDDYQTNLQTLIDKVRSACPRASLVLFSPSEVAVELCTSSSSVAIGTGSKTFTIASGQSLSVGQAVLIDSAADGTQWMYGTVTSYSGTTLGVDVTAAGGSGTYADWGINVFRFEDYVESLRTLAVENGIGFVDNYHFLGDYIHPAMSGVYSNPTHIGDIGGTLLARNLNNYLEGGMRTDFYAPAPLCVDPQSAQFDGTLEFSVNGYGIYVMKMGTTYGTYTGFNRSPSGAVLDVTQKVSGATQIRLSNETGTHTKYADFIFDYYPTSSLKIKTNYDSDANQIIVSPAGADNHVFTRVAASFGTASKPAVIKQYAPQTQVGGSTSGTATCSMPYQGTTRKKVLIYCNALLGTASYTFPTAFTNAPYVSGDLSGIAAATTTGVTLTGTTSTGWVFIEGF
jgi:hypothetical protein